MTQDPEERAAVDPEGAVEEALPEGAANGPGPEQPEADIAEQRRTLDEDREFEAPPALSGEGGEGDVLDQRRPVPPDEDSYLSPE